MSSRDSPVSVLSSPYSTQVLNSSNQSEEYLSLTKNVLKSPFRTLSPTVSSPKTIKAPVDEEDEEEEEISQYGSFLTNPTWSPAQGIAETAPKSPSKTIRRVPLAQPVPSEAPSAHDVEHILSLRAKLKEEEIEKRLEDKMTQLAKRMEDIKIAAKQELQQLQQVTIKTQEQYNMQLIQEHDKQYVQITLILTFSHNAINKVISDMTKKQEEEQRKANEQVQRAKDIINMQKQKEQQEENEKRKKAEEAQRAEAEQKQKEADEKKRQEELQKKLKEEANQKALEEKKKLEQQKQPQPSAVNDNNQPSAQPAPVAAPSNVPAHLKLSVSPGDPDCISNSALTQLISRMTTFHDIQAKVKTLEQDPSWPNAKKDFFKKINMALNTLSNSSSQILKKFDELAVLLNQTRQQNPLVYYYCIDLISSKVMDQGSTQVSLHRDSCYSYAALVVALASKFPDFGEHLLGYFHKACPYTLPYYPVKQSGQSDAEYMESLGFKRKIQLATTSTSAAPEFESEDANSERMRGILSIYAAITQTHFPNIPNFHGITFGWTWFARILNMKPRKITADIILTFLEVAGHKLLTSYNKQFHKILAVLKDEMLNALPKEATASNTRLQLFLNEYSKTMKIATPKAATFSD